MSSVDVRGLAESAGLQPEASDTGPLDRLDTDMAHVLRVLADMSGLPLEKSTITEARAQPTLQSALSRILRNPPAETGVAMELGTIPDGASTLRTRIYTPDGTAPSGGRPVVLYLHDGSFVTGELDQVDGQARQIALRCDAVVVAAHYRQAPEFKFPAAHEDATTIWKWLVEHASNLGGDEKRLAVVGEGSGGNLALALALQARADGDQMPMHIGLVTPMASMRDDLPSHLEMAGGTPFNSATLTWATRRLFADEAEARDPRMNPAGRSDLAGLPPVTLILASADPLRSEGEALGKALQGAGVRVDQTIFEGVTHGFFGLHRVVTKALFAQTQLARNLKAGFAAPLPKITN
ncbi:alpha/beta hydrolase [Devosia sp.]|uniref:alpha/beta hydrolase n=1 Tax=Devosia sp. TaxID=1871048 RepID=UPI003A9542E1